MLHNSDPFGSSEAPLNMGASVNMTLNGPMNIPNGFNMGKSSHEASQNSNTHNLPTYPGYGYPVMSPHTPMHHFQNFHSNVFQSSFMGHNSPALHDSSWQHGLLPMNLNTHADNSSNMNFYDRKDFGYSDYKDQNLHSKNVPLNVPQVYSKAYHKEAVASHASYHNYQDPNTLRSYDKTYLDNNLDLSMNKTQKLENRSYDLDLSTKTASLDESRRRSLENTVKMIENILIHNPTSSSSNHSMSQIKNSQTVGLTSNENKNMYNEKLENKNTYIERSGSKNIYTERSDYKNLGHERPDYKSITNERQDYKNIANERPDYKNAANERSDYKNIASERQDYKNIANVRVDYKNVAMERQDYKNIVNERPDYKSIANERPDNKTIYTDVSCTKNVYNEIAIKEYKKIPNERQENKNMYNEVSYSENIYSETSNKAYQNNANERQDNKNIYNEVSCSKNVYNETSSIDYKNISNERPDHKNMYSVNLDSKNKDNDISSNKNQLNDNDRPDVQKKITNVSKSSERPTVSDDRNSNVTETNKNDDSINIKSIYSCSTENSVESEINSDERNNNFTNSSDNEINISVNEESSENQIEKIEIKVELPTNDSESESDDVKPLAMYAMKNPLQVFTEVSQADNGIEVKVEDLSSWADSEQCNPFQRDIFGIQCEGTTEGTIVSGETSVQTAKEAIGKEELTTTFYECSSCSLYFTNPKKFLIHSKWHGLQLPIEKKTEQEMQRVMKRNMRKEARKIWKMNSEEVKEGDVTGEVFKCNNCEKMFSTRASLKNHKQRFHPTLVRECLICHKTLIGWQAIKTHRATEHTSLSDSRYQCTDCPKRFKFSHSLVKHLDTHLEKTHGCELCPKMFGSQKLLSTHMKTHERVMRGMTFHCSYCGKGFFESYQLQVHERTHRNERPFLCQICNTSFGTNSSLQRHLKVSHSSAKPWQCSTCHRNFVSEKIRDRHVLRHHGDAESFKFLCTQCPCRYLNQKDLNKHVQKNHPRPGRKKRSRKNNDSE